MIGDIYEYDDLKKLVGGRSPSEVAARLVARGIKFNRAGLGKPFTTLQAINDTLGIKSGQPQNNHKPVINVK